MIGEIERDYATLYPSTNNEATMINNEDGYQCPSPTYAYTLKVILWIIIILVTIKII